MSDQQQEQDRTEPASQFKLQEARKRGQVAKSLEVNSFLILSAVLIVLHFVGSQFVAGQLVLSRSVLANAHQLPIEPYHLIQWCKDILRYSMSVYWPLVAMLVIIAILANLFQTGPIFSFFSLKPDVKRLNPVTGLKRMFSKKLLFDALKTIIKLSIFGFIIYLVVWALMPSLLSLVDINPSAYPSLLLGYIFSLSFKLLMALLLIALLDLVYTRWDFAKRMRMSKREQKEEVKRRDGDPMLRAKMRELQKEAVARAGSLQRVPDADVLITNPTHIAIAVKYERDNMSVPQVIAKGAGDLAMKMKQVAYKNNVTVVENKPLARQLLRQVGIDEGVPESLYPMIAKILAWVFTQRQQQARFV